MVNLRILYQSFIQWFVPWFKSISGIVLLLIAIFIGGAFLSYSPLDTSLNTASETVTNLFGTYGAYYADFFYQIFGNISWFFIIALFVFSGKIIFLKENILNISSFLLLLLSLLLFCVSIQSFFDSQVSLENYNSIKTSCGAIGFVFAQKIYSLMKNNNFLRYFFPLMLLTFFMAFLLWKHVIKLTFKGIFGFIIKVFSEIQKILKKLKLFKNVKVKPTSQFQSADTFLAENETSLEGINPSDFNMPKSGNLKKNDFLKPKSGIYKKPSVELLALVKEDVSEGLTKETLSELSKSLLNVLAEFGINGEIVGILPGPVVTMYEFRPAPGIKTSRVISLADDIARYMSALSARIATIPGKNAIGIELPNNKRNTVFLRPLLQTFAYTQTTAKLPLILGKDISGKVVIVDLVKMPHLLVAGTTGSGKSVSINTMILSLVYKFTPEQCRFIMIDPKMLELSVYDDIPHLLTPVVTDPKKAIFALKWAVREMETRYKAMSRLGVRNIENFNQKIITGRQKGDVFTRRVQTGFDQETGKPLFEDQSLDYHEYPYIVVVLDEMADLMLVAGKEIESAVQRLAQMARAAGIHLIMATQRPSVDVITGTIKANFPTRISFQVSSKIDSRTILGEQGAEQLLGHGDMLYMSGGGRLQRVHGPFVSDNEVEIVAKYLKMQGEPDYVDGITDEQQEEEFAEEERSGVKDDLFQDAVDFVRREGRISISFIQRQFSIGYNKAAKLVEQMEKQGIVTPPDRTGKRELL
ncbi:MAG: DNA translocase FtsK 4TM domain-containing protein [Holosporales bacterium]|jgi:S-DNA-T family DNA segregation ATPase FtsK/SpoIIIE|nr:DNA translocase FtsK 4TM domain-containing protein [Holosporales bacterium]